MCLFSLQAPQLVKVISMLLRFNKKQEEIAKQRFGTPKSGWLW